MTNQNNIESTGDAISFLSVYDILIIKVKKTEEEQLPKAEVSEGEPAIPSSLTNSSSNKSFYKKLSDARIYWQNFSDLQK